MVSQISTFQTIEVITWQISESYRSNHFSVIFSNWIFSLKMDYEAEFLDPYEEMQLRYAEEISMLQELENEGNAFLHHPFVSSRANFVVFGVLSQSSPCHRRNRWISTNYHLQQSFSRNQTHNCYRKAQQIQTKSQKDCHLYLSL